MAGMAENSARKQRGRPFQKGHSGNPAGKPKGTKHHATRLVERLFDGAAEEICKAVIDKANTGDMVAARIIVERLCPPRKDRPVTFELPKIGTAADAAKAASAILAGVAGGNITPSEAAEVNKLLEAYTKILEITELEARIAAPEKRAKGDEQGAVEARREA
jgi:Family of unknown function (DUF5681)